MAYCIFIKSLRIVEEFRKNPCVKIPPKSPCANFQSLCKFPNPFFIPKGFFYATNWPTRPFGPLGPAGLPLLPLSAPAEHHLHLTRCRAKAAMPPPSHAMEWTQPFKPLITPPPPLLGRIFSPSFTPVTGPLRMPFTTAALPIPATTASLPAL
jgi:hypothetical protein